MTNKESNKDNLEKKTQDIKIDSNKNPVIKEIGGPKGVQKNAEPTRYGDWEVNGKCSDF